MIKYLKKNKEIFGKCYLVILVIVALFFKEIIHHGFTYYNALLEDEFILFWKVTPWTLSPMLVCTLLAAFFTDKGHGKEVGLAGMLMLFASSIVLTGGTLWASTPTDGKMLLTQLGGYSIHMPIATFLVASSFMRGGAVALLLSVLTHNRTSFNAAKELKWQTICTIVVCILAITIMRIVRPQLSWAIAALLGAIYILMLVPGFYCFKKSILGSSAQESNPETYGGERYSWIMPVVILYVCVLTITSYHQYVPYVWRYYNYYGPFPYMAIDVSAIAFAISLFIFWRRRSKGNILTGAILLLFGLPLWVLFGDEILIEFIPMIMIGVGLAMIIGQTLVTVVKIPIQRYALSWVCIVSAIIILCKLIFVVFNRMAVAFNTRAVALFIAYPLLALLLMVLGYLFNEKKKKDFEHE